MSAIHIHGLERSSGRGFYTSAGSIDLMPEIHRSGFDYLNKPASSYIPFDYQYESIKGKSNYANGSTADYLAESFMLSIYESNKIPVWTVRNRIEVTITLQLS